MAEPVSSPESPEQHPRKGPGYFARLALGRPFWVFTALAVAMGTSAYLVLGQEAFNAAVAKNLGSLSITTPRIVFALMMAGFMTVLLPREALSRLLGRHTGLLGMSIASFAGLLTPGGPASAFPLLAIMGAAGADRGIMIAYITAWATLGIQRIVMWDLPLMGPDFTLLRIAVSLPLPIIAGLIARRIPITIEMKEEFLATGRAAAGRQRHRKTPDADDS